MRNLPGNWDYDPMTFKSRPYDPDRPSKQTPAQQAATMRNFGIFKLRGLHAQMGMLTGPRRELAQMLVDQELIARGALPMDGHWEADHRRRRKRNERFYGKGICPECREKLTECDCIPF